jgi:biotin-dependent carboxylase-like uncharacterized protein
MDPVALSIANMLVGNERWIEGLEITLAGPTLKFLGPAVVSLAGAPIEALLDGSPFPMWSRKHIKAGQKLTIGKTTGGGCRSYLAVHGGFANVASYFGSKATSPIVAIGGYQGRQLSPGDQLSLIKDVPKSLSGHPVLPEDLRPDYGNKWEIMAMPGPHEEGYLTQADIDTVYSTEWKVSHNASRSAIRLVGPVPQFARPDGGEGGSHPSNVVEYGYSIGSLNWTGDEGCIFGLDSPNFGGFASSATAIRADYWKLGQLKAGATLVYKRVSLDEALALRTKLGVYLNAIEHAIVSGSDFTAVPPFQRSYEPKGDFAKAVIWSREPADGRPQVRYRQAGDDYILVEYGNEQFDLNYRCRTTALEKALHASDAPSWLMDHLTNTISCCTSITICYDGARLPRDKLVKHLQFLEDQIGDLSKAKVPCRRFKLPLSFESKEQTAATKRYMETLRPQAPYLPDNLDFVARNNAFTAEQLKHNMLNGELMAVVVGFFCGNTVSLPVDPRQRMSCPKTNPSRTFTPEGTFGWGGSCASIYPVDSPGGYQMLGRTIPCFDYYGFKSGFTPERPWIFQDFDLLTFYQVSEDEFNQQLELFRSGQYRFEWEDVEFDMAEHNKLLEDTAEEVKEIRAAQAKVQLEMIKAENESLEQWRADKAKNKVDDQTIDSMLEDPNIEAVESPVDANVWRVEVSQGDDIKQNQIVVILEAMKLEININAPESLHGKGRAIVEKLLVEPGETIKVSKHLNPLKQGRTY